MSDKPDRKPCSAWARWRKRTKRHGEEHSLLVGPYRGQVMQKAPDVVSRPGCWEKEWFATAGPPVGLQVMADTVEEGMLAVEHAISEHVLDKMSKLRKVLDQLDVKRAAARKES